jgi:putative transposase
MKDEINIDTCETFEEGVQEIDEYMDYHNNHRGQ